MHENEVTAMCNMKLLKKNSRTCLQVTHLRHSVYRSILQERMIIMNSAVRDSLFKGNSFLVRFVIVTIVKTNPSVLSVQLWIIANLSHVYVRDTGNE